MTKPIRYRWRRAIRKIDRRYVRMSPGNKDNGNNSRQDATIEIMGGLVIMREKERGILRFAEPSSVNVDPFRIELRVRARARRDIVCILQRKINYGRTLPHESNYKKNDDSIAVLGNST